MKHFNKILAAALVSATMVLPNIVQAMEKGMSRTETKTLYEAGGFSMSTDGDHPVDRCGNRANPRITFIDINADGRKDALFIDQGPCYAPDNSWFGLAARTADGSWRKVGGHTGQVQATGISANRWLDLKVTSGGTTLPYTYDGHAYAFAGAPVRAQSASTPQFTFCFSDLDQPIIYVSKIIDTHGAWQLSADGLVSVDSVVEFAMAENDFATYLSKKYVYLTADLDNPTHCDNAGTADEVQNKRTEWEANQRKAGKRVVNTGWTFTFKTE